jgi:hypothetical protein
MAPLGYSNFGEAFVLGSDQIKNTQEEIAKLKALVMDSSNKVNRTDPGNSRDLGNSRDPGNNLIQSEPKIPNPTPQTEDTPDILFLKMIQHPNFDDTILKNYMSMKSSKSSFGTKEVPDELLKNILVFVIIAMVIYFFVN